MAKEKAPQMQIEWRDVPGHEGYMVNSLGEVWSKDRIVEKTKKSGKRYLTSRKGQKIRSWGSNAYLYCSLDGGKKSGVHRIVCAAFHGMPDNERCEVAHLDGNAHNNTPDNLAWVTHSENEQMKKAHGTYYIGKGAHPKKSWHKKRGPKRTVHPDAQNMIKMRESGAKWSEIAKAYGMSTSGVFGIVKFRSGGAECR